MITGKDNNMSDVSFSDLLEFALRLQFSPMESTGHIDRAGQ